MDESQFLAKVEQLRARLQRLRSLEAAARWSLHGAAVVFSLVLLLKVLGRPASELVRPLWALLLFPLGGAVLARLRRISLKTAALRADRALDLKERLTTAVEWILEGHSRTVVAQSLLQDAARHAAEIEPQQAFPLRLPRARLRLAAVLSGLAAVLLLLPPWNLFGPDSAAQQLEAVHQASESLAELARDLPLRHPETPDARRLSEQLEELARQLREPGMDEQEAAARISELHLNLRRQSEPTAGGREGRGAGVGEAEAARERLRQIAGKLAQGGSVPQARESLRQLAESLPQGSAERAALEGAAQALEDGDRKLARQACAEAGQAMDEAASDLEGEVLAELEAQQQRLEGSQGAAPNPAGGATPGPGQGTAPADFGQGTTNREEASPAPGEHHNLVRQSERTSEWSEEYQRLYQPQRLHRDTAPAHVRGALRGGGELLPTSGQVVGAPRPGGAARLTPQEVFLESKRQAEQAVSRDTIPAQYRDTVRNYFDGIDPR